MGTCIPDDQLWQRTLSDSIVYLVHIQVFDIRGKDTVEQLRICITMRGTLTILEITYDVQNLLAGVQPPHGRVYKILTQQSIVFQR